LCLGKAAGEGKIVEAVPKERKRNLVLERKGD
jgi:hypothetical protein